MNVNDFRHKISEWRIEENFSQEELDEECGFRAGTVARIEQGKLEMKDEQFVRILRSTGRDLLWVLLEDCGDLYSKLRPLDDKLAHRSGTNSPAQGMWRDTEFETALTGLLSGAQVVLSKVAKASDPKPWVSALLLRAASRASGTPQRKRVRKQRNKAPSE
jgi:transcriptional regulator with XRE-family HTH domain